MTRAAGLWFATAHSDKRIGAELLEDPAAALAELREQLPPRRARSARRSWFFTCGSFPSATGVSPRTSRCSRTASTSPRLPASRSRSRRFLARVGSPLENVRRALERDDRCRVTLDTEFLAHHAELDAALADDALWERVAHIHVKDYAGSLRDA